MKAQLYLNLADPQNEKLSVKLYREDAWIFLTG